MKLAHRITLSSLILVIFIFGTTMMAKSQDKKIGFGIQATPAITWMNPDDEKVMTRDGTKTGLGYGLMFDLRFGENYSLSTGLNVVSSRSQLKYLEIDTLGIQFTHGGNKDTLNPPFSITYNLNYVEIPIHLLLKTNEIGYMTYFGQFGLATQIKTKAKGQASGIESWVDIEDVSDEVKALNMGLSIGAGFEYSLGGNTALVFALIYNNGFTDVLKNSDHLAYSKSIALKLGVMF